MKPRATVLAVVAVAVVGAGALVLAWSGPSNTPNVVEARPAAVERSTNSVDGKGIPPSSDYTYSAPPDANPAPTANLKIVASYLQLKSKSVTVVVTLPAGLGTTNRVDVSVAFDERGPNSQRITQTYSNAKGNRIIANLADGGGQRRQVQIVTSLAEMAPNGSHVGVYAVRSTVNLEPLYDISLGHFHAYLYNDCDSVGDSEPHVYWAHADGQRGDAEVSMSAGEDVPVPNFARTFTEAGQTTNLKLPTFLLWEEDVEVGEFRKSPPVPFTPLLPGTAHTVAFSLTARNDNSCNVKLSYRITYTLRQYPNQ
jgi:hypothetical protein